MVIVEKSFPRGGTFTKSEQSGDNKFKDEPIFGTVQKKTKKRSANIDATSTPQDNEIEKKSKQTQADLISYETVQEGMLLMGVVRAIDPLGITVSLPGRMIARVSALDISNAYIKTTAKFVQNADDSKDYKPLTDLFSIGQIIYGRIEEIKQIETGIKHMKMTLKPSEVHKDLIHSSIKKGFVFNGAIEEIQEHGFIIETGIRGLRSFLPKAKSKDKEYATGQLVFLKVETVKNDKTATTVICKEVDDENLNLKSHADPNLDYILPTTIVQFKVSNILKDGLEGTIMGESLQAFASEHHLQNALMLPEDFEINSIHRARILYIMPITKQVYVTLNFEKVELISDDLENIKKPHYTRGDVVANAKVHHLGTDGIVFILDNQFKGIMTYKSVKAPFSGNYDHDQIVKKYTKKSKHTVRILGYDLVESTYTCTDEPAIVNEKFFVLEDVNPGDIVTGIVGSYDKQANAYIIRVGKLKGLLEEIYTAAVGKIQEHAKIRCRVLSINKDRNTIYLTNRAEYMQKDVKMLADINEAKPKQVFTGTIVKTGSQFYLVKFFNGIQGFVYRNQLPSNISSTNQSFYEGQTMRFRIVENNQGKLTLTLPEDNFNIGEICPVIIKHVLDAGLEIEVNFKSNLAEDTEEDEEEMNLQKYNGFIPLNYLSDYEDLQIAKLSASKEGMSLTAACIGGNTFSIRDVSYFQVQANNSWSTVKVGDILKANIKNVEDEVLELVLLLNNFEKSIKVHWKMLLQNINLKTNINFSANQVLYVKVLSKETTTKTLAVSAKLMDVWDGTLQYTADYAAKYLNEVETIKSNLLEKNEQLAAYELGEVVTATFSHIDSETKNWIYSIENNSSNSVGVVRESFIRKTEIPKEGTQQKCVILWIDYSKNILYLSNKTSDLAHISKGKQLPRNFIGKSGMSVKLLIKLENMLICSLKKGLNPIVICPNRLHDNDFENSVGANLIEGEFYKIAFIHDTLPIALPEDLWKIWKNKNLKRSATSSVEELPAKKERLTKEEKKVKDTTISNKLQSQSKKDKPAAAKGSKSEKCVADTNKTKSVSSMNEKEKPAANKKKIESLPFFEDIQVSSEKVSKKNDQNVSSANLLIGVKDFWQSTTDSKGNEALDSSSEEEEEETDQHFNPFNSKSKKLTSTEKFKRSRQEESRLREIEEKFADPNQKPETVEQYERLVISDPNNSKNWINFMVHHLQLVEVEKARAIARRALKTISFKNTDNLINMWVALLNLELRYGTISNFDEAFKEALTCNDPLKIYLRVIDILISAKKTEKLIDLLNSFLKKFKGEPEAWKAAADAYFQIDLPDKAQQMLHRALTCLPEREHVNTIVAFANLNYRHKRRDIAQTLYDQVVTSYPKRVDVWNQYIDMLIKDNLVDQARSVLDRAINQNIPMKKMRTLFKKLLDIETKFGSDADIERVKNMAAEYVKKNSNI